MISPTNNLAKLGIGAAHAMRIELADQLFFPVAVDLARSGQPMSGGAIGNRGGAPTRLTSPGAAGNTGGFAADFSNLTGDPISVIKTMTSDGPIFTLQNYKGSGIITIEDPTTGGPYSTVARYMIKNDGYVYDLLALRGVDSLDTSQANVNNVPYQHWEFANATPGAGYDGTTNTYTPTAGFANNQNTAAYYSRPVGRLSFQPKEGASQGAIQEQLTRAQSTLDTMSRMLRSLHDEAKGPFSNFVIR